VPKNDIIFSKQRHLKGMGESQNGFRKDQGRKGQLGPTMGRYSDQKVFTLSKEMKRDQQRTRHINYHKWPLTDL